MKSVLNESIEKIKKNRRNYRRYLAMLLVLTTATTLGVNWGLHQNGISQTADYVCRLEEHTHTEECYAEKLICTIPEGEAQAEASADADLLSEETADETAQGHTHTDSCYEQVLVCEKQEHTHTVECMIDAAADVETAEQWEATVPANLTGIWADDLVSIAKSQIDYTESEHNFTLSDDGTTQMHYTRYGAWYGNPYGDWSTMFAAFCLHYAGISTEHVPTNSGVWAWTVDLQNAELYESAEYVPTAGDIAFLCTDGSGNADHVGIISEVQTNEEESLSQLTMIVGDDEGAVTEKTYIYKDGTLTDRDGTSGAAVVGYCALPENPDQQEADDGTADAETKEAEDSKSNVKDNGKKDTDSDEEKNTSKYPAFTYEEEMSDGTVIAVDAPEGAFPKGIKLALTVKDAADYLDAIQEFAGEDAVADNTWFAYDFDFYTDENHNIEPKTDIKVTFSNLSALSEKTGEDAAADAEEKTEDADAAVSEEKETTSTAETSEIGVLVYHIGDAEDEKSEQQVTQTYVSSVDAAQGTVEIETSEFSTQVIGVSTAANDSNAWGPGGNKTSVDHIDIGIKASASVTINGKTSSVNVTLEKSDFTSGNVTVSAKYQSGSSTPSFNTNNFSSITTSTGTSGIQQYRVNGSYDVGTLSNPVIYTFTLKKNVTFDIDGESVTLPVTLSQSFHYFQADNDCPGIHNHENLQGRVSDASGLDFVLTFDMKLISIGKQVVDENGNELTVSGYTVYFDVNNSMDSEAAKILLDNTSSGWVIEQVKSLDDLQITEKNIPETVIIDGVAYTYLKTLMNGKEGTSITIDKDASSITVKNVYSAPKNIRILKYAEGEASKLLPGAQFTLTSGEGDELLYYKQDGTTSAEQVILTTDEQGAIAVKGLQNGTYTLTEIQAPDGYNTLKEPITIAVSSEAVTYNNETIEKGEDGYYVIGVTNTPGYVLPATGGAGTNLFTAGGIAFTAIALLYGCTLWRRRGRRAE